MSANDKLTVGDVYEIDPLFKAIWIEGGSPQPAKFYAKLIGFNSDDKPIFERGKDYQCWSEESAIITPLKKEAA